MEIIHDSQEVQGDTIPAVILGDTGRFLPDEEGGYFLTVHGVDEDLLQEDGGATVSNGSSSLRCSRMPPKVML